MYYDIEEGRTVTTEQLRNEYLMAVQEGIVDNTMSFRDYLWNSMASNGGTLERRKTA